MRMTRNKHSQPRSGAIRIGNRSSAARPRPKQTFIDLENPLGLMPQSSTQVLQTSTIAFRRPQIVKPIPTHRVTTYRTSMAPLRALYNLPKRALYCVKRKTRKEVIFALGLSGKNGTGGSYRRTLSSNYSCGA